MSGICHGLTHARLRIRGAELCIEETASGVIGETRVKPSSGSVAPDLERHCPFAS